MQSVKTQQKLTLSAILNNPSEMVVYSSILVTPDDAAQALQHNVGNRPLSGNKVEEYARAMQRGEWRFNGDNICFSATGKLLNGQHRMAAVAKSGMAQVWNIQTGLPDDSFDVMDIGKNRTAADVLSISGISYGAAISSAVKIIAMYYEMKIGNMNLPRRAGFKMSNHQVLEWIAKHDAKEKLERYAKMSSSYFRLANFMSQSTYAAFLYIFGNKDRDEAILFFEMLAGGQNISAVNYSMIYLLRQKFINMQNKRIRMDDQRDKWALLIKAWNAFREGREIKQLSYNPDVEAFPQAI